MNKICQLTAVISLAALLPLASQAGVYVNQSFDSQTIGNSPTDPAQAATRLTTVAAGNGLIGTGGNVANLNSPGTGTTGYLEYNVGASALGSLYVSFNLANNAPVTTGSAANPVIFAFGPWNASSSATLTANASRSFSVEFYQTGASSTLRLRTNSTAVVTTAYDLLALQSVQIWANDNNSTTLSYTRPDNATTATLGANSFVIWINGSLVATETDSGFAMNPSGVGSTVGNATLGRVGFDAGSSVPANFLFDNIYIADTAPVPEPTTMAMILSGGLLLAWRARRRSV